MASSVNKMTDPEFQATPSHLKTTPSLTSKKEKVRF
jgi:hypothetical protein